MSTPGRAHRTTYHHGDLRNALVEAATAAVRAGGPAALVVREIAREVGVSPNAAYRHFASHADLLATVAAVARRDMARAMLERLAGVPGGPRAAHARLGAVGRGYVEYAVAEPGLFRAAFDGAAVAGPPGAADPRDPHPDPWWLLQERLDELAATGDLDPDRRAVAGTTAWAAVHGLAVLLVEGPLAGLGAADREAVLTDLLRTVDEGLTARR
ncbi:TetR/AcrR family transcriptional regulator [Kineococcus terrestris]|uniref:TetR/AcrR family transcriptional regulator n=1 Tax=Kineococcus terrestris TaxID=2044856 RepID=UPI0034DAD118